MRTKTLLLTAALSAAGVAASMAQVYSVNVVGYVNITVPKNTLKILANPLANGANTLSTILPLADTADGAQVYIYRQDTKDWNAVAFFGGVGWLPGDGIDPVLAPGQAFFLQAPPTADVAVTFVGEVMQTGQYTLSVPIRGLNELSMVGSQVPMKSFVGYPGTPTAGTMGFPAADGDQIYVWNQAAGAYDVYPYFDGVGWLGPNNNTDGPEVPVGEGFWVQKAPTNPAVNWTRTFTVQ